MWIGKECMVCNKQKVWNVQTFAVTCGMEMHGTDGSSHVEMEVTKQQRLDPRGKVKKSHVIVSGTPQVGCKES